RLSRLAQRCRIRCAPRGPNTKKCRGGCSDKQNGGGRAPAPPPTQRSIRESQDAPTTGFHGLQFAGSKKADVSTIWRPEGKAGVIRSRQWLCRGRVQRAYPELRTLLRV